MDAERRHLNANGPHFRIAYRTTGHLATPKMQIVAVYLVHNGREFQVGLGTALLRVFDYMARHNKLAQTAKQMEAGTREDRLIATRGTALAASIRHRYVRVYIERIRTALSLVFDRAGLGVAAKTVLASEGTATNETAYRLHATVEWR